MKKTIKYFLYTLLITTIVCSCENKTTTPIKPEIVFNTQLDRYDKEFKIVAIDSCEYLYTDAGNNGQTVFHKGNCKFCIERNKK